MSRKTVTLDVRDELRAGREPFGMIMQTVAGLAEDQDLLLIAPFEPVPLFGVLGQRGYSHRSSPAPDGGFQVLFSRQLSAADAPESAATPPSFSDGTRPACGGSPVLDVDARGLEPPQPMVKVLEALGQLPEGARLRARTDRRPMHLYAQLEDRGFTGESEQQADGSFVTLIRRK